MQKLCFFFALVLGFSACKVQQQTGQSTSSGDCNTIVLVKDMQGLDGCQFLLEEEDGTRLLATSMPKNDIQLANNLMLKISYEEVKDAMSICMAEDKMVEVTCIENLGMTGGIKPQKKNCDKLNSPNDVAWMKALNTKIKPNLVTRHIYNDGFAYELRTKEKELIYDCQGNLICEGMIGDCSKIKGQLREPYVIWKLDY